MGSETVAVLAADLDRDGILDLVAANRGDDTLSILLGKGDGTFNSPLTLPTGRNPYAVVAADVDGDGLVDLAAANRRSNTVSVYHGRGNGLFESRQDFAVAPLPVALAVGDLNRDGRVDLVTANQANTVTLLRGLPGGGFERRLPDLDVGSQPIGVLIADFDGDRLLDVMTVDSGGGTVTVLRGNGDGTFQTRFAVPVGQGPAFLAADDLNGDGRLDVVTPNARESTIGVLLGPFTDATTVTPATPLRETAVPTTPFLRDFNGDGRLDSVILDRTGQILYRQGRPEDDLPLGPYQVLNPGRPARDLVPVRTGDGWTIAALDAGTACTVTLYRAPKDGQLAPPADLFSLDVLALRITAGDLSGTGRDSLILSHPLAAEVSIALPGRATASFQEPRFHSTGANPTEVTLADLDGDHDLDVLVNATASGDLTVLDNDPNQHFDTVRRFRSGTAAYGLERGQVESLQQPVAVLADDFLPGGGTDVLVLHQGLHALVTLVNNGRGGLLNPQVDNLSPTTVKDALLDAPGPMVAGDLNGDHWLDLAVLDRGRGQVLIYLGRGDGTPFDYFVVAGIDDNRVPPALDNPLGLTAYPNPTTGRVDLVVGNAAGDILWMAGRGDGKFDPPPPFTGDRTSLSVVVSGGRPTVVVANQQANRMTVQTPSAGGNRYLIASALPTPPTLLKAVGAVTTAQLDGYGALERIVVGTGSNNVVVYGRNGAVAFPVGTRPVAVTVADLNADNVPDLVVTNQGSNNVSVLFGGLTASGGWTAVFTNPVPSGGFGPLGTIVQDTDRDGRPDLVITNSASAAGSQTGSVTVVPAAGLGFFRPVSVSIPLPSTPTGPFPSGTTTVTPDTNGRLIGLDLSSMTSLGVVYQGSAAVSAVGGAGGRVVVVLANGRVDLLQPTDQGTFSVAGELVGLNGLPSDPSALAVLETESGFQVLVTASGSDQLFVFELPSAEGAGNPGGPGEVAVVAETSSLDGESLVVVVTLLAGGLAEGNYLASVVAPGEDDAPTIPIAAEAVEGTEQAAEAAGASEAAAVGPEAPAPEVQLGPPVEEDPFAPGPPSAVEEDEASAPAADEAEDRVDARDEAAPPLAVTGSETPAADADLAVSPAPADVATPLPGAGSEADVLPALTAVALGWAAGSVVADRQPDEKIVKSSLDPRPRLRQHG
ncbi:MAG: FG-GAP-like repeat-containing protein [Gemmataceae bacterium]